MYIIYNILISEYHFLHISILLQWIGGKVMKKERVAFEWEINHRDWKVNQWRKLGFPQELDKAQPRKQENKSIWRKTSKLLTYLN